MHAPTSGPETRVRDKTGRVIWLRCEGVPRMDDAGRFLGYTGCNVDITERGWRPRSWSAASPSARRS